MSIIDVIIPLIFIVITLDQFRYIKKLLVRTRKSFTEISIVVLGIFIFIGITYFYARTWIHYIIGVLGIFMFISMWIKQGITLNGFTSMYRYKPCILWSEIQKVSVIYGKDIKVKLFGGFMEQAFRFKKSDYEKVTDILREKLPAQVHLDLIYNKE
ncbi:hypothetical protein ACH36K_17615 [Clostridium sp. MB05]|uniref:hypothetical protein n=1 Tax=Clostridium sp. MB05 TaxID=3376682 RepID=UPI00398221C6